MDKQWNIHTEEIQRDGKDTFHCHRYEPTPYYVLELLFEQLSLLPEERVVDYGCGLGRLNFFLAAKYHIASVGIERSRHYYEEAQKNLSSFRGQRSLISFENIDATQYEVSPQDTVFYFFNPFSEVIFRQVVSRITESLVDVPRKAKLILYYPLDEISFYLQDHTIFSLEDEVATWDDNELAKRHPDRREKFSIYSYEP